MRALYLTQPFAAARTSTQTQKKKLKMFSFRVFAFIFTTFLNVLFILQKLTPKFKPVQTETHTLDLTAVVSIAVKQP